MSDKEYIFKTSIFFVCSLAIIGLEFFILLYTTGGWSGVVLFVYGGIFSGAFILIQALNLWKKHAKGFTYISVKKNILLLTIATFIPVAVLNIGDCGDAPGSYVYAQSFFLQVASISAELFGYTRPTSNLCSSDANVFLSTFWRLALLAHIVCLIALLAVKGKMSPSLEGTPKPEFKKYLIVVILIGILSLVWLPKVLLGEIGEVSSKNWIENQVQSIERPLDYNYSLVRNLTCKSDPKLMIGEVIEIAETAGLPREPEGRWVIGINGSDTCVWSIRSESQYEYNRWRGIKEIRIADSDGSVVNLFDTSYLSSGENQFYISVGDYPE